MVCADLAIVTKLVASIYRSAFEPSECSNTIADLRLALGGARACLVRIGPDMRPDDVLATGADSAFDHAFAADARLHDNVFSKTVDRMPIGPVVLHDEIWDAGALRRSPLWNEYLSPQDIHCGLMVKTLATGTSYWFVGASRSCRHEPFGETERALLAILAPHFRRAAEIGRALEIERRASDARSWIGGAIGLVTVNSLRRIEAIDAVADSILAGRGCGLKRRAGRLEVRTGDSVRFAGLVRQACRTGLDPTREGGGEMVARADPEAEGAFDVLLSIRPGLDRDGAAVFAEPCAVIAMRTMSPALPSKFAATVAEALALTAKEAKIATLLATGSSLQNIAAAENIAITTARAHLKQVFAKTGKHQQSALVALLRTIEPLVRRR